MKDVKINAIQNTCLSSASRLVDCSKSWGLKLAERAADLNELQ